MLLRLLENVYLVIDLYTLFMILLDINTLEIELDRHFGATIIRKKY